VWKWYSREKEKALDDRHPAISDLKENGGWRGRHQTRNPKGDKRVRGVIRGPFKKVSKRPLDGPLFRNVVGSPKKMIKRTKEEIP